MTLIRWTKKSWILHEEIAAQRDEALRRVEELEDVLRVTRVDIRRRLASDDSIDAPYDEDLAIAEQRIDRALAADQGSE